jgi:hypothetical protein
VCFPDLTADATEQCILVVSKAGKFSGEAQMRVNPEIRRPLMNVGNYLGFASAYVLILLMIAFAIAEVFLRILRGYL